MTDHDRIAYEACGYTNIRPGNFGEHYADGDDDRIELAPWSSADAAIAHAERGGFHIEPQHIFDPGGPYRWKARVRKLLDMDDDVGVFSDWVEGDWGWTQGEAIRNAIVAHAKGAG